MKLLLYNTYALTSRLDPTEGFKSILSIILITPWAATSEVFIVIFITDVETADDSEVWLIDIDKAAISILSPP